MSNIGVYGADGGDRGIVDEVREIDWDIRVRQLERWNYDRRRLQVKTSRD